MSEEILRCLLYNWEAQRHGNSGTSCAATLGNVKKNSLDSNFSNKREQTVTSVQLFIFWMFVLTLAASDRCSFPAAPAGSLPSWCLDLLCKSKPFILLWSTSDNRGTVKTCRLTFRFPFLKPFIFDNFFWQEREEDSVKMTLFHEIRD